MSGTSIIAQISMSLRLVLLYSLFYLVIYPGATGSRDLDRTVYHIRLDVC